MNRKLYEDAERAILQGEKITPPDTGYIAKYEKGEAKVYIDRLTGDSGHDSFIYWHNDSEWSFSLSRSRWHWLLRCFPWTKDHWHDRLSKAHQTRQKQDYRGAPRATVDHESGTITAPINR